MSLMASHTVSGLAFVAISTDTEAMFPHASAPQWSPFKDISGLGPRLVTMSNVKLRARRSRLMGGSPFQRGYSSVGRDAITPTRVIESGFALSWPLKLDGSKNLPQLAESIGWVGSLASLTRR